MDFCFPLALNGTAHNKNENSTFTFIIVFHCVHTSARGTKKNDDAFARRWKINRKKGKENFKFLYCMFAFYRFLHLADMQVVLPSAHSR